MENRPQKEYINNINNNSKSFSSNNHKKIPHPKSKNLKYYPITTNNSYQGEHIIYLAAEDDEKNKLIKNIKKKSIKKRNKTNKFLSFQRSIEMEFPKINNISTSKNSCDNENSNSKHQIKRSYSVENYTNVTNKSFDILGLNLKLLENSKIMDINFINGIKDSKRKNNLLNALNKYNRYKSWGNINEKNNNIIILNEGKNENNSPKIEKKFDMKNGCNIIEEDENENSENDTINTKKNNKDYVNKKNSYSKEKDIIINSTNIKGNLKLDNSNKEKSCQPIHNKISKEIKILNQNINNNKIMKVLKPINNNKVISKEINKSSNEITNKIYQENKKYIKKSIQNEINKIFKINNVDQNKKLKININNNINNNIKINNNININNNNLKNISPKITKKILVRKIMREEKYIIDDKGNKKVIEINQSILDDKDNNKNNTKKIMIKKGRYHRNSPRTKLINDINSKPIINGYYRNNKSPMNNHFIKSKTSCNSNKKDNNPLKNNRIIINSPFIYNNNIYSNPNLIYNKKNYINRNNKILTETRTPPNENLSNYKISFINDNNNINNNHAFHEIKKLSKKNNDKVAKTIYHDYSNEGKKVILNNNFENILVISENKKRNKPKIINRSYSNSYFQIPNNLLKNEIGKNLKKNGIKYRNKNYEIQEIPFYYRNNQTNYMISQNINERYINY